MSWVAPLVIVGVALVLTLILAGLRNRLVSSANCESSWAQVDVQLKKRHDLIPNPVETVEGYAAHERSVFEEVTNARTAAPQAQGARQQGATENVLRGSASCSPSPKRMRSSALRKASSSLKPS